MTDYVVSMTTGRSTAYPANHYGGHFTGTRATFCLNGSDLTTPPANVIAMPNTPVSLITSSPVVVTPEFFGMHVGERANDGYTAITTKTVRSHDLVGGKSRWQFIEPTDNVWDFTDLDLWVNTHYALGKDLVFTLFGTPNWASARKTEDTESLKNAYSSFIDGIWYNRGICAEPGDMAHWDRFCNKIATRYLGKIKYYEVWNEPNLGNNGAGPVATNFFFSGTFAKLSEMTRRANQVIKAVDPTAKIIGPATTNWVSTASGQAETYVASMLATSSGDAGNTPMKNWIDIFGVHLYVTGAAGGNSLSGLSGIIDRVNAVKAAAGISSKETWDTESSPTLPMTASLSDAQAIQYLYRAGINMAAKGISRSMFYKLDSSLMGFKGRAAVEAAWNNLRTLLMSGNILGVSKIWDGRIVYTTSSGVTVV